MTQGGPAIPVVVVTDRYADGGPALRVAVVSDGRPTEGGPARPVIEVTDGRPTQGNEPVPIVAASGVQAQRPLAGPAIPIVIVSGSLALLVLLLTEAGDSLAAETGDRLATES